MKDGSGHPSVRDGANHLWASPLGVGGLLLMLLLMTGCGGDDPAVEADGPPVEPVVVDLHRIGSLSGSGWDAFARIGAVAFDDEGRLYILDSGQGHVVVLDSEGELVRTFGRRGQGPEELRRPEQLVFLESGELAIYDAGHQGFLVFTPDGEFRRSVRAGVQEGMPTSRPWGHGADGAVAVSRRISPGRAGRPGTVSAGDVRIRRYDLSGEGGHRDLFEPWRPPPLVQESEGGVTGGPRIQIRATGIRGFEPSVHLAVLPGGRMVVADTSSYRLRFLSPSGEEEQVVERPVPPRPVGDREAAAERERRLVALEEDDGPRVTIQAPGGAGIGGAVSEDAMRDLFRSRIEEMVFWHEVPVIQRIAVDRSGRVWVRRSVGAGEPGPVDLLTADGDLLGTIPPTWGPLPDAFGPDGLAAWVELDDLDVPHVRVGRVEGIPDP